jgi:ribosomal protein S18 acetylase RimI-like enzyme
MENIYIREVTESDIDQLQKIGRQTFFETFSMGNTEENMKKYLEEMFTAEKLTAEFSNPNVGLYFAEINNNVVGYLKLNSGQSQTKLKDDKTLEIERIYELREYHGKKVGQLLYDKAIQVATEKYAEYVWLGVWD